MIFWNFKLIWIFKFFKKVPKVSFLAFLAIFFYNFFSKKKFPYDTEFNNLFDKLKIDLNILDILFWYIFSNFNQFWKFYFSKKCPKIYWFWPNLHFFSIQIFFKKIIIFHHMILNLLIFSRNLSKTLEIFYN